MWSQLPREPSTDLSTGSRPATRLNPGDKSAIGPDSRPTPSRRYRRSDRTGLVNPVPRSAVRRSRVFPVIPRCPRYPPRHAPPFHQPAPGLRRHRRDAERHRPGDPARGSSTADIIYHRWSLIRSRLQLDRVLEGIEHEPGPVLFTLVDRSLRRRAGGRPAGGSDVPVRQRARPGDGPAAGAISASRRSATRAAQHVAGRRLLPPDRRHALRAGA